MKNYKLKIRNYWQWFFLLPSTFCLLPFLGCGKKETKLPVQQVTSRPKPKLPEYVPPIPSPRYTYKGGMYRDPLVPGGVIVSYLSSSASGESDEVMTAEKMATLQLNGVFSDRKVGSMAIISETSGNSYILKKGKLYNAKNKIIKNVAGVIGEKSVTLISSDAKVELKLKKRKEEKKQ